jgi:hypothetical protein
MVPIWDFFDIWCPLSDENGVPNLELGTGSAISAECRVSGRYPSDGEVMARMVMSKAELAG